jgi:multiple antibiotic resistance protein
MGQARARARATSSPHWRRRSARCMARPMDLALYIPAFVTLFVIIDPIGLAPLFVALTQGMTLPRAAQGGDPRLPCRGGDPDALRRGRGGGAELSRHLHARLPASRAGLLLFLTALDMLFERRTQRRQGQADTEHPDDPSVFPLAIPLIAGPGAIASMILLTGQEGGGRCTSWPCMA